MIFDFNGLILRIDEETKKNLIDLQNISDSIEITHKLYKAPYNFFNVTIKKNDFSKKFQLQINKKKKITNIITNPDENNYKILTKSDNLFEPYILSNIIDSIVMQNNLEIQEKIDIIYCKNDKCPICNSEMQLKFLGFHKSCQNECYSIFSWGKNTNNLLISPSIFDGAVENKKLISFKILIAEKQDTVQDRIEYLNETIKEIKYWKENDRYLSKLLQGGN